jgi:hypothetical protein
VSTFGVTTAALEPLMLWAGSLSSYSATVALFASQAGRYVGAALDRSGFDVDEVAARASTDELFTLCAEVVALRAAAALASSLMGQECTQGAAFIARSEELLQSIVRTPHAVDRDGYNNDTNTGGCRVALKAATRWRRGQAT